MEQYLANALIGALPTVMAFACIALLGLRALAYNRSGFLAVSSVVVCNSRNTRPNLEVTSNTSFSLLGLDVLSIVAISYGAQLNWRSDLSGLALGLAFAVFMFYGFTLVIHNFRIAMSTVKDESSTIPVAQRIDTFGFNLLAGLLASALMLA